MMIGSFVSETELDPRMRMRDPPPVVPLTCVTITLGRAGRQHVADAVDDRLRNRVGIDGRHGMGRFAASFRLTGRGYHNFVQPRGGCLEGEIGGDGASWQDNYGIVASFVAKPQCAECFRPVGDVGKSVHAVVVGSRSALGTNHKNLRILEWCPGGPIRYPTGDRPLGPADNRCSKCEYTYQTNASVHGAPLW